MAEYAVADARYCFPLLADHPNEQIAPLLCAGLIGYRALRMCGEARRLGLYGFGAAAHIILQVARSQGREVFAFNRDGDEAAQAFARELGASWVGGSEQEPPEQEERVLRSVANLTRQDAREMLDLAPRVPVQTKVSTYRLEDAARALDDLRNGRYTVQA